MKTSMIVGFAFVVVAALIACDDDDDSPTGGGAPKGAAVVPAAWQGEWEITLLATPCNETDTLLFFPNDVAFICEGDTLTAPFSPFDIACEGTVTDTRIDIDCDDVLMEGPCRIEVDTDWTMTRNGDEFTGLARVDINATGGCEPDTMICVEFNFAGTRVGDGVAECSVVAQKFLSEFRAVTKAIVPRKPAAP